MHSMTRLAETRSLKRVRGAAATPASRSTPASASRLAAFNRPSCFLPVYSRRSVPPADRRAALARRDRLWPTVL